MAKPIYISKIIKKFKKKIKVSGDKSLSIRWALIASQAIGKSRAYNLLKSDDLLKTMDCLKKLGIKIKFKNKYCEIKGNGLNSFIYKNNLTINAGNSGTLGRLILALLIKSPKKIKLIGDKSLSKRDFARVIDPLKKFGAIFYPKNKNTLPIYIKGSNFIRPINYFENKGSAQCKSSVMLAALNAPGKTIIKAKKSRTHTETLLKYLKYPIKVKSKGVYDHIEVKGLQQFKSFDYNVPGDPSSAAYPIVLTLLSKNSKILIENVLVSESRIGLIKVLRMMGASSKYIKFEKKRNYFGEKVANIRVRSCSTLKGIAVPSKLNSFLIDEFPLLFLLAIKSKNQTICKNISELNAKESPRLKITSKILTQMGVKNVCTEDSIKIFGNPDLDLKNKKIEVKDYLDHRIVMFSFLAANIFSGSWKIHGKKNVQSSFPTFYKLMSKIGSKFE